VFHVPLAHVLPPVWAIGCLDYVNDMINEPPRSGKRELLDKIMTVYFNNVHLFVQEGARDTVNSN